MLLNEHNLLYLRHFKILPEIMFSCERGWSATFVIIQIQGFRENRLEKKLYICYTEAVFSFKA